MKKLSIQELKTIVEAGIASFIGDGVNKPATQRLNAYQALDELERRLVAVNLATTEMSRTILGVG